MDKCSGCGKYDAKLSWLGYCGACQQGQAARRNQPAEVPFTTKADRIPQVQSAAAPLPAPAPVPPREVGPGYRFANRYVVERELGHGGMGKVYLARDERLDRQVAVKVIRPQDPRLLEKTAQREEYGRAFLEEAKLGAELDHPNIAKVFDYGLENGEPFTVFEYVEGETLGDLLRRRGALPLEEVRDLAAELAEGLTYAHERHIVHRDLKPANVRITPAGKVKILDLGLAARFREEADWRYCGTPTHVSPEQVTAQPCDGRTDQYALAVMVYQMVTGRLPFYGDSVAALLMQHVKGPPPDPRTWRADLPGDVAVAIQKGLAKKPADRFADCAAFAAALGCMLVRKGGNGARLVQLARLKGTSGKLLKAQEGFGEHYKVDVFSAALEWVGLNYNSQTLYLGLATDGLYVWHCEEVTKIEFSQIHEATASITVLTLTGRDGHVLQAFTFVDPMSLRFLHGDLERLRQSHRVSRCPTDPERATGSVVLLDDRLRFTHQTLGAVTHVDETKAAARVGVQLEALLLGADAVTEVKVERLPTFFNSGYRASGIAVRAIDREGRLQMRAVGLEKHAAELAGWMGMGLLYLYGVMLFNLALMSYSINDEWMKVIQGLGINLAAGVIPLFAIVALRTLRWPQLVRPVAIIVTTLLLGMTAWGTMGMVVRFVAIHTLLLLFAPILIASIFIGGGFIGSLFVFRRTKQFLAEYRRLGEQYPQATSWRRRLGSWLVWTVAAGFLTAAVGLNGVVVWETAHIYRAKVAEEAFNSGLACLPEQPELARDQFRKALGIYRDLHARFLAPPLAHQIARTHFNLAEAARLLGRTDEMKAHFGEAIPRMVALLKDRPRDPDCRPYPDLIQSARAVLAEPAGVARGQPADKPEGGNPMPKPEDAALAKKVAEADRLIKELATSAMGNLTNPDEVTRQCGRVTPVLEDILRADPQEKTANMGMYLVHFMRGNSLMMQGKPKEAHEQLQQARPFAAFVRKQAGEVPGVAFGLATFRSLEGWALASLGNEKEAEEAFKDAEATLRKLIAGPAAQPTWRFALPSCLSQQVELHRRRSQWAKAEACLVEACDIWDKVEADILATLPPAAVALLRKDLRDQLRAVRFDFAGAELDAADDLRAKDQHRQALPHLRKARNLLTGLVKEDPKEASYRHRLAGQYRTTAAVYTSLNDPDEAEKAYQQAAELFVRSENYAEAVACHDAMVDVCDDSQRPWYRLQRARLRVFAGDRDKAVEEADAVVKDPKTTAEHHFQAARVFSQVALKDPTGREEEYVTRALALLRLAVEKGFKDLDRLKSEKDLNIVRPREDFQRLIKDLEAKDKK